MRRHRIEITLESSVTAGSFRAESLRRSVRGSLQYGRAGTFIKEGKSDTLEKSIHLNADVLGDCRYNEGETNQEDPVCSIRFYVCLFCNFLVCSCSDSVEFGSISLQALFHFWAYLQQRAEVRSRGSSRQYREPERRSKHRNRPEEHPPWQPCLQSRRPRMRRGSCCAPCLVSTAECICKQREKSEESDAEGDGTAHEDTDHTRSEFSELAEITAEQHDEDHGIQDVVL